MKKFIRILAVSVITALVSGCSMPASSDSSVSSASGTKTLTDIGLGTWSDVTGYTVKLHKSDDSDIYISLTTNDTGKYWSASDGNLYPVTVTGNKLVFSESTYDSSKTPKPVYIFKLSEKNIHICLTDAYEITSGSVSEGTFVINGETVTQNNYITGFSVKTASNVIYEYRDNKFYKYINCINK